MYCNIAADLYIGNGDVDATAVSSYISEGESSADIQNIISLSIKESGSRFYSGDFKITVKLKINYGNTISYGYEKDDVILVVDYKGAEGAKYNPRSYFSFDGAKFVKVTITEITASEMTGNAAENDLRHMLLLENEIRVTQFFDLAANVTPVNLHTDADLSAADELNVKWDPWLPGKGVTHTQLEWAWVEDEMKTYYQTDGVLNTDLLFRNNSTRVDLPAKINEYNIPKLYGADPAKGGIIYYRVRAVNIKPNGSRADGPWSTPVAYNFNGHESSLNWQVNTSFAEEGKRNSVIGYFDGSLRPRQTVTKDNSTNTTVTAETMYDAQGRPAIQILPVPGLNNVIKYQAGLNLFNGQSANADPVDFFDLQPLGAGYGPGKPMNTSEPSGATLYYGPSNPEKNDGFNKFIPDAKGFPYTQTQYMPDGTGRIMAQSGVGPDHKIGSGHETKYYYTDAVQEELDGLFGTEAGDATHYFKNMVSDANGQMSVSYVDMHGRTIATALAGEAPASLDNLAHTENNLTRSLLTPRTNIVSGNGKETINSIAVPALNTYNFAYTLAPGKLTIPPCNGTGPGTCFNFLYDLEISIIDESGEDLPVILTFSNVLANPSDDCNSQPAALLETNHMTGMPTVTITGNTITFSKQLTPGSYTVRKTLSLNKHSLQQYADLYATKALCKTRETLISEIYELIKGDCEQPSAGSPEAACTACRAALGANEAAFRTKYLEDMAWPSGQNPSAQMEAEIKEAYKNAVENCDLLCGEGMPSALQTIREQMLLDMKPYEGQYAREWNPNSPPAGETGWSAPLYYKYDIFSTSSSQPPFYRFPKDETGAQTFYKDASGVEDGSIYVVGAPSNGVLSNMTKEDFAAKFKDSWSEALIYRHPEFQKLHFAETTLKESYNWIDDFIGAETYLQGTAYFPGQGMAVPASDPFYLLATPASGYRDVMTAKMNTKTFFNTGDPDGWISMWQLAYSQVKCVNIGDPATRRTCMINAPVVPPYTDLTDEENEKLWKAFRGLYAAERRKDVNKYIAANTDPVETDALIAQKYRVYFPETNQQIGDQGDQTGGDPSQGGSFPWWPSTPGAPPAGVSTDPAVVNANTYETQCSSYIDQWKASLRPCIENFVSTGYPDRDQYIAGILTAITNGMKQVCIAGSDAANPYGSSTVPSGYTGPAPASFEAVIHQVFATYNIPKSALCNPFVIEWPKPYGTGPKVIDSYTTTVDECACTNFGNIKTQAIAAGYNPSSLTSLNAYLELTYKETLTQSLYNALQNCSTYTQQVCGPNVVTTHCDDPSPCLDPLEPEGRSASVMASGPPSTCKSFQIFLANYFDEYGANPPADCQNTFTSEFNSYFQLSPEMTWTEINNLYQSLCNKTLQVCQTCTVQTTCATPSCTMQFVPYQLTTPQPMPEFLKCGYTAPRCVTCQKLSEYTADFKAYFSSPDNLAPAFADVSLSDAQIAGNILYAKYLNYYTGFQYSWSDYARAAQENNCVLANYASNANALQTVICGSAKPLTDPADLITPVSPCQKAQDEAIARADEIIKEQIRKLLFDFEGDYLREGFGTTETFTVNYDNEQYHYTLYYYDMAGSLVKTIPPAGVHPNFDNSFLAEVKAARLVNDKRVPAHEMATQYRYNSLGQVVAQNSPDGNTSQFWYDKLGRLVVSQNAEQASHDTYSYTLYDKLGRITEVGEKASATAMTQVTSQSEALLADWINASGARKDITNTVYDVEYGENVPILKELADQQNLRNRVSYSLFRRTASLTDYESGTFYTYDIHGNVDRLLQDFRDVPGMASTDEDRWKLLTYDYDLISGKVNMVSYQPDLYLSSTNSYRRAKDKFFHKYKYDAQNRLTEVLTSRDKIYWESDARYRYYKHGPLARTEYGQLRVQGIDYAYTLQGWLKGVNGTAVSTDESTSCPEDAAMGSVLTITDRAQFSQPLIYRAQQVINFEVGFQSGAGDQFQAIVDPNSVVCTPGSGGSGGSSSLVKGDMGEDGSSLSALNSNVATDVYGYSLNYYNGDYAAIAGNVRSFATGMHNLGGFLAEPGIPADPMVTGAPLFNGNISSMMVTIPKLGEAFAGSSSIETILYGYRYDQLNRLVGMNAYKNDEANSINGTFSPKVMRDYKERISYDPNGNILSYLRNGTAASPAPGQPPGGLAMDDLSYKYLYVKNDNSKGEYVPGQAISDPQLHHITNQLASVRDAVGDGNYHIDIDNQAALNYTYDKIGNLIEDKNEGLKSIEWTVYGKIRRILKDADKNFNTTNDITTIEYLYDVAGNRISKTVTPAGSPEPVKTTIYSRDASGNVMAVYEKAGTAAIRQTEVHLYGSSRIGMITEASEAGTDKSAQTGTLYAKLSIFTRHEKIFELSNHLGNVLVTLSDRRIPYCPDPNMTVICGQDGQGQPQACECSSSPYTHFYKAEVVSANDYYPFGMGMVGRGYSAGGYRYGFNGKENDDEVKGEGNQQDYGLRIYDPRLGRFLSVDPLADDYPFYTPYQFAGNDVIRHIDLDGGEPAKPKTTGGEVEMQTETTYEDKIEGKADNVVRHFQTWVYHEGGVNGSKAGFMKQEAYFEEILKPLAKSHNEGNYKPETDFWLSRKGAAANPLIVVDEAAKYIKENPTYDSWAKWLPIWGSLKQAQLDFSAGNNWSGAGSLLLAASDVFLVKSVFQAPVKAMFNKGVSEGLTKYFGIGMSHEFGASVSRWKGLGLDMSGFKHHWLLSQELMERYPILKPIGNQTWNLTRFETQASHMRWAHGQTYGGIRYPFARQLYGFTSTPGWLRFGLAPSTGGRLLR